MTCSYPSIRAAALICSACQPEESIPLVDYVQKYMRQRLCCSEFSDNDRKFVQENTAVSLFYSYAHNAPDKIKKPNMMKRSMRELWLDLLITQLPPTIKADQLMNIVRSQYQNEQKIDQGLHEKYFNPIELVETYYKDTASIISSGNLLRPIQSDLRTALHAYSEFFNSIKCPRLGSLYADATLNNPARTAAKATSNKGKAQMSPSAVPADNALSSAESSNKNNIQSSDNKGLGLHKTEHHEGCSSVKTVSSALIVELEDKFSEMERKLKKLHAQNAYLEQSNHDKDVKMAHAEKDAARALLLCITDESYGSPLNELYLLKENADTPPAIRRVISNLFLALEQLNIKTWQKRLVGQTVEITAQNADQFNLASGSELKQGDHIRVCYPGYRIGYETVCRPVVQKSEV